MCSQEQAIGPYPETDESSSHSQILIFLRSIFIVSSHTCLGLPCGLYPSGFLNKFCIHYSSLTCILHVPIISSLTWLPYWYLEKSINYKVPHYAVFSSLLLLLPLKDHIFSSGLCSSFSIRNKLHFYFFSAQLLKFLTSVKLLVSDRFWMYCGYWLCDMFTAYIFFLF
jgi:hypothetical protein